MNGHKLQVVDKIINLGCTISKAAKIDDEVSPRTAKASLHFANVYEHNSTILDTKLKVCNAVLLPTIVYAGRGQYINVMASDLKAKFQCHPARNLLSIRHLTVLRL